MLDALLGFFENAHLLSILKNTRLQRDSLVNIFKFRLCLYIILIRHNQTLNFSRSFKSPEEASLGDSRP